MLHVGAVRGCCGRSARPRRPRGPGSVEDGHCVGGFGRQRRLCCGRRRLRERIVDDDGVQVRACGVERPRLRCAGGGSRFLQRLVRRLGTAVRHRRLPGQRRAELRPECRQRELRLLVVLARVLRAVESTPATAPPGSRSPVRPNDVEGWRFQNDEPASSSDPPPGVAPSYAQICNAVDRGPTGPDDGRAPATADHARRAHRRRRAALRPRPKRRPGPVASLRPARRWPPGRSPASRPSSTTTDRRQWQAQRHHDDDGLRRFERGRRRQPRIVRRSPHRRRQCSGARELRRARRATCSRACWSAVVVAALAAFALVRWRRRPAEE